ncbi:ABC transporter permease [Salipiger sp. P9]|uniref:ABC transporter permease n=1 Tax=Salipiger pentaromativorans TaxID=2943193 RepID=UPI00215781BC|nr:ABC transporter permease [Salipiger pentaromativorans]MCR8549209.1 ABC transporter permease [Salipiger pentaromativorans]
MKLPNIGAGAWTGLAIFAGFILLYLLVPPLTGGNPRALSTDLLQPPSPQHLFGTDELGRDVFLQFVDGVRISFTVGFAAAAATSLVGIIVGAYAGFSGGAVDLVVMRITEMFQVIPTFVLAAVIVAMWGPGLTRVVVVIALLAWPPVALVIRGEVLRIKRLDFVDAVRCLGYSEGYILLREIIPNAVRPVFALATLAVGQAILLEASLSFLGLSDPSQVSWGRMLSLGQSYLLTAWWISTFPGLAIFLTVLACNFVGDGIGAYVNPKGRKS